LTVHPGRRRLTRRCCSRRTLGRLAALFCAIAAP